MMPNDARALAAVDRTFHRRPNRPCPYPAPMPSVPAAPVPVRRQCGMGDTSFQRDFRVAADHPSLPGHFPGAPLVPGVMLLEQVALALRDWRGQRLARVQEVKFVAPLLPEERAALTLTEHAGRVRFEIRRDGELLARGAVEGAP